MFGGLLPAVAAYGLGAFCLRGLQVPRVAALAVGAALESTIIFFLLLGGEAHLLWFATLAALALLLLFFSRPISPTVSVQSLDHPTKVLLIAILGAYGLLYFIHALAPEIQPDGITYHLGLVREYARLGRFPDRVGFYEMIPQGLEMLFLFAFVIGKHSAAKLVHFVFLAATVPLMIALGRRLKLRDGISATAAALYFCAPVVGLSGTSSYNDAGFVFFVLAAAYFLLAWKQDGNNRYVAAAGLAAGFCYAIKIPGLLVVLLAVLFVLWECKPKAALIVATAALLMIAPWMVRNTVLTGNPFAPLFNNWFPNPYFHYSSELHLRHTWKSYGGFVAWRAPWDLAVTGRLTSIVGPLFLLSPLSLLALRSRAGRLCWIAALALATPWLTNVGTRFIMPALPFVALAMAMVLPRRLGWACLGFHAISCWPGVRELYERSYWKLPPFPLRAALRLESEQAYLSRVLPEFQTLQMLKANTRPEEAIFALASAPYAYLDQQILEYWHCSRAERLRDALQIAAAPVPELRCNLAATWPPQALKGLRFQATGSTAWEWRIYEARLFSGPDRIYSSPHWTFWCSPNRWEIPAAFDDNLASAWRSLEPVRPGMYIEVMLDRPQLLTSAQLVTYPFPTEILGQGTDSKWRVICKNPSMEPRPPDSLRRTAVRFIKQEGFRYILTPLGKDGNGSLGQKMAGDLKEWGLELVAEAPGMCLLRIL